MFDFFKDQVASLKEQTILWLELLGATILSHMVSCIHENSNLDYDTYYWTDSVTVLCWLKQYVKNRVKEI